MSYRIPKDLDHIKKPLTGPDTRWQPFPLDARIRCVISDSRAYPLWTQRAAVALTTIEQPTRKDVPVCNPAGIMCQGLAFDPRPLSTRGGWGWGPGAWNRAGVRPCGWADLHEGIEQDESKVAPFLAFASFADSMRFVLQQCFEDGGDKYDGDDYCRSWFGITPDHMMYAASRNLFNTKLAQVVSMWPSEVQVEGWRDVGAANA